MKNDTKALIITIAAFLIVLLVTVAAGLKGSIKLDENITIEHILGVLTSFMILTLVVERFADVVITGPREFKKKALKESVAAKIKEGGEPLELNKQLDDFRSDTRMNTMKLNLFLGLLIGLAGYRILSALTGGAEGLPDRQQWLFHSVDILLTAGLIAGGSKGINIISKSLRDWFKSNKES